MNDNYPLISVIVPAYNHENYVEVCLNSILEDNYPNKEIVIIDDGSKDNTKQIIENWIAKNNDKIKIIFKSRENKGIPKTLNELIDLANGEYIVLIASDDYLLKGGIYVRYNYLINNPKKMAVIGDCIVIDDNGNKTHDSGIFELFNGNKEAYYNDKSLKTEIVTNFSLPGPILMVKKEIYDVIGKYDEALCFEDGDFYTRAVIKDLLGFINHKVSVYRFFKKDSWVLSRKLIQLLQNHRMITFKHFKNLKGYRFFLIKNLIFYFIYEKYLRLKYHCIDINCDDSLFFRFILFIKTPVKKMLITLRNN